MTLKTGPSNIGDEYIPKDCDIVKMENFVKEDALTLALKQERAATVYNYFSENNFTLYKHEGTESFFVEHTHLAEVADFKGYQMKNQLMYQLAKGEKTADLGVDDFPILAVQFISGNPEATSVDPTDRFIHNPVLSEVLGHTYKHVTLLKIVDNNLSFGSYFFNTASYQTYEADIIELVNETMADLGITAARLKFVGAGTGAFAALYFAKYFSAPSLTYVLDGYLKTPMTDQFLINQDSIINKYQMALSQKTIINHLVCLTEKNQDIIDMIESDETANVGIEKVTDLTKEKMLEVTSLFVNDKAVF